MAKRNLQLIYNLLEEPKKYGHIISWTDESKTSFTIHNKDIFFSRHYTNGKESLRRSLNGYGIGHVNYTHYELPPCSDLLSLCILRGPKHQKPREQESSAICNERPARQSITKVQQYHFDEDDNDNNGNDHDHDYESDLCTYTPALKKNSQYKDADVKKNNKRKIQLDNVNEYNNNINNDYVKCNNKRIRKNNNKIQRQQVEEVEQAKKKHQEKKLKQGDKKQNKHENKKQEEEKQGEYVSSSLPLLPQHESSVPPTTALSLPPIASHGTPCADIPTYSQHLVVPLNLPSPLSRSHSLSGLSPSSQLLSGSLCMSESNIALLSPFESSLPQPQDKPPKLLTMLSPFESSIPQPQDMPPKLLLSRLLTPPEMPLSPPSSEMSLSPPTSPMSMDINGNYSNNNDNGNYNNYNNNNSVYPWNKTNNMEHTLTSYNSCGAPFYSEPSYLNENTNTRQSFYPWVTSISGATRNTTLEESLDRYSKPCRGEWPYNEK